MEYKYHILAFFIGGVLKMYDDLNDNSFLFDYLKIAKHKDYINEILKMLFGIGFTIISLKNFLFFLIFVIINIEAYYMCKQDYNVFEISGIISSVLLIPFTNIFKEINLNDILILSLSVIWFFGFEYCSTVIKEEYSYKKLIQRTGAFLVLTTLFFINNTFNLVTTKLNTIYLFTSGYTLISSIFQYIMIKRAEALKETKKTEETEVLKEAAATEAAARAIEKVFEENV